MKKLFLASAILLSSVSFAEYSPELMEISTASREKAVIKYQLPIKNLKNEIAERIKRLPPEKMNDREHYGQFSHGKFESIDATIKTKVAKDLQSATYEALNVSVVKVEPTSIPIKLSNSGCSITINYGSLFYSTSPTHFEPTLKLKGATNEEYKACVLSLIEQIPSMTKANVRVEVEYDLYSTSYTKEIQKQEPAKNPAKSVISES